MNRDPGACAWLAKQQLTASPPNSEAVQALSTNTPTPPDHGRPAGHLPNPIFEQDRVIERSFAWLHAFKRLRTRYEHRADIHLGMLQLACALICYGQLETSL